MRIPLLVKFMKSLSQAYEIFCEINLGFMQLVLLEGLSQWHNEPRHLSRFVWRIVTIDDRDNAGRWPNFFESINFHSESCTRLRVGFVQELYSIVRGGLAGFFSSPNITITATS